MYRYRRCMLSGGAERGEADKWKRRRNEGHGSRKVEV